MKNTIRHYSPSGTKLPLHYLSTDELIKHNKELSEVDDYIQGLITESEQLKEEINLKNEITQALIKLQSEIFCSPEPHISFSNLLNILISVTNSEYGFIWELKKVRQVRRPIYSYLLNIGATAW